MEENPIKYIRETKKKFLKLSLIGVFLITVISVLSLKYHQDSFNNQQYIQDYYGKLKDQVIVLNKIKHLSLKLNEIKASKEKDVLQRNLKNTELDKLNADLLLSIEKEDDELPNQVMTMTRIVSEIQKDYLEKDILEKRKAFLKNIDSKKLKNGGLEFKGIQENFNLYLSSLNDHLHTVEASLEEATDRAYHVGFFLIILSVLQILLIWVLVFKPLYSTIVEQHFKISDILLKEKSANRSKSDFLANISHEIRTPMTSIMGYIDVINSSDASQDQKQSALRIVEENSNHLLGLIDEILDISKMEAGRFELSMEPVELPKILNSIFSLLHVKAEEKGIKLKFNNEGPIPKWIQTDPKRLRQILFNILGNAIKFTNEGKVELMVSQKDEKLIFKVIDTGIGINSKNLKSLFQPFSQADTTISRKHGGTGLGLVLSKNLAHQMGGDIKIVETQLNKGTTFEINIDYNHTLNDNMVDELSTSVVKPKKELESDDQLNGKDILVVDDAKENARLFKIYLSKAQANVDLSFDGVDALDKVKKHGSYDLILLDLQMPKKDGFQVVKELRTQNYTGPIIALTAHAMKEEREKAKHSGFDDLITKPVKADYLIQKAYSATS